MISAQFFHRKGKGIGAGALVFKSGLYVLNAIVREEVFESLEEYMAAGEQLQLESKNSTSKKKQSGRREQKRQVRHQH